MLEEACGNSYAHNDNDDDDDNDDVTVCNLNN